MLKGTNCLKLQVFHVPSSLCIGGFWFHAAARSSDRPAAPLLIQPGGSGLEGSVCWSVSAAQSETRACHSEAKNIKGLNLFASVTNQQRETRLLVSEDKDNSWSDRRSWTSEVPWSLGTSEEVQGL